MRNFKKVWLILGIIVFIVACAILYMLYNSQVKQQQQLNENILLSQAVLSKTTSAKQEQQSKLAQLEEEFTQKLNAKINELNLRLDESNKKLDELNAKRIGFEEELEQSQVQLNQTQLLWSKSAESIEFDDELFTIANDWGLEINAITASEPSSEEVKDITYSVTKFVVQVQGEPVKLPITGTIQLKTHIYNTVDDIISFLNAIDTDDYFTNVTVKKVDMTVPELPTSEEIEEMSNTEIEELVVEATIELNAYTYEGE